PPISTLFPYTTLFRSINLTVAPLASIAGRLVFENDPKAGCAKRRETAAQETLVFVRRYEPEKKTEAGAKPSAAPEVSITSTNYIDRKSTRLNSSHLVI